MFVRSLFAVTLAAAFAVVVPAADPPAPNAAKIGPKVGDEAKDFELTALDGEKVKLSKLTAHGPVVLVVLRGYPGYQCPLCTKQFAEFRTEADAFKAAGRGWCSSTPVPPRG